VSHLYVWDKAGTFRQALQESVVIKIRLVLSFLMIIARFQAKDFTFDVKGGCGSWAVACPFLSLVLSEIESNCII